MTLPHGNVGAPKLTQGVYKL